MKSQLIRRTLIAVIVVIGLIAVPFIGAWYESSTISWPREQFSAAKWKAAPHRERYRQYNNLMATHDLVGSLRGDVEALLGPPDYASQDGQYLTYNVKEGGGDIFTLNSVYYIRVWIDSQGKVTSVRIGAD